ncbi:MAG TPA: DUF1559 domain-containing protein, partial [Gemmataceae bacterium]|nr:DUF1559 domain-containing protein [Gemmataceae bacterium]
KQIGLALHTYERDQKRLPAPRVLKDKEAGDDQNVYFTGWQTWFVFLQPFLEQENTFRLWDLGHTYNHTANGRVRETPLKVYLCPSRRDDKANCLSVSGDTPILVPNNYYRHYPGATSDYAGAGHQLTPSGKVRALGVFGHTDADAGVRFADISDGLSNTVMVGEKHIPEGKFGAGWYDSSTYNGDYPRCWTRVLDVPPMGDAPTSNRRDSGWRFGSWHPGVVPYLFADGAVRTISTIKPPANLQALGAYNDGMETPRW